MICTHCGTVHHGERVLPGSGWIELILWLCYIVPGLIYSIWRRSKKRPTCAQCGSRDLVPLATPAGKALVRQYHPDGVPVAAPAPPRPPAVRPGFVLILLAIFVGLPTLMMLIASL